MRAQMDELNCGFVKVEQLDGNVGYVKFNGLLTSARTFSGAEEFSYNLKSLKRATIIGETTGGGAHPVSGHAIGEHFMMGVPFARAVNSDHAHQLGGHGRRAGCEGAGGRCARHGVETDSRRRATVAPTGASMD
jgi:hypothetical protein